MVCGGLDVDSKDVRHSTEDQISWMMHGDCGGMVCASVLVLGRDLVSHILDLWLELEDASMERRSARRVGETLWGVMVAVMVSSFLESEVEDQV